MQVKYIYDEVVNLEAARTPLMPKKKLKGRLISKLEGAGWLKK